MIEMIAALLGGVLYGLIIGIIPAAGATTGLIALFGFISYFIHEPYLGVIFLMAVVAASTTGDSFTAILLGIPGANSAAATMVDGFPLAQKGRAGYAISAAVTTSTINGLIWGCLVFLLLPWYTNLIMIFGVPELWAFTVLALATVGFLSNRYWFRTILAIALGILIGLVGVDPENNEPRFTMGWFYLEDGVQIMAVAAGLFAIPELTKGLFTKTSTATGEIEKGELWAGMKAVWHNRWLALRGGFIGAFIGLLPGLGGQMADWLAYGSAVASNPKEKFGNGNIKGVIGPEGANNSQKATSMVTTVIFGIPGAKFAAILMSLFMYLNIELGTPDIVEDTQFFTSMTFGFLGATIIVAFICMFLIKPISKIASVPYKYYFPVLLALIIFTSMQYTGGWEDLAMLAIFSCLGFFCKHFWFSRPALLIGYILADKVEGLTLQLLGLYTYETLITRPIFMILAVSIVGILIFSIIKKGKIDYA
jgi:putative tricarboxylic transport membrane protein